MKNSKKTSTDAGQSIYEVKKSQKHDANLQKNSSLYFQIGLILCLLGTYALFEMQFQQTIFTLSDENDVSQAIEVDYVPPFIVEVIRPVEPEPLQSVDLNDTYKIEENDTPKEEAIIKTPDEPKVSEGPIAKVGDIPTIEDPVQPLFIPFSKIETVPVYPGCEKYTKNADRKKCMSDKITKLIHRRFNTDIGTEHGVSGRQRISTQFTIDKDGNVSNIQVRGPHHAMEKEAERVINKIPKMQPGLQGNTPVGVIYTLPIVYDVVN